MLFGFISLTLLEIGQPCGEKVYNELLEITSKYDFTVFSHILTYPFHFSYILGHGYRAQECKENAKDTFK